MNLEKKYLHSEILNIWFQYRAESFYKRVCHYKSARNILDPMNNLFSGIF